MIPELSKETLRDRIAKNVAALVQDVAEPFVLNLGVGIPTLVSNFVANENIFIQSENGMVGVGHLAGEGQIHPELINAGRQPVLETPGCCYTDSSTSFGMFRGGHMDATVLGAFQVDRQGNIANWIIPNGRQLGVGGAMDLVAGANKVIIAMSHTDKGKLKLVEQCSLPITGLGEADVIVTELAVFFYEPEGIVLKKIAPEITVSELKQVTGFDFIVPPDLESMLS
jgi:3-oxoacid CoA-transferase B subunit